MVMPSSQVNKNLSVLFGMGTVGTGASLMN